jgi:hypothetical protein
MTKSIEKNHKDRPQKPWCLVSKGAALDGLKKYDDAIVAYHKAISIILIWLLSGSGQEIITCYWAIIEFLQTWRSSKIIKISLLLCYMFKGKYQNFFKIILNYNMK